MALNECRFFDYMELSFIVSIAYFLQHLDDFRILMFRSFVRKIPVVGIFNKNSTDFRIRCLTFIIVHENTAHSCLHCVVVEITDGHVQLADISLWRNALIADHSRDKIFFLFLAIKIRRLPSLNWNLFLILLLAFSTSSKLKLDQFVAVRRIRSLQALLSCLAKSLTSTRKSPTQEFVKISFLWTLSLTLIRKVHRYLTADKSWFARCQWPIRFCTCCWWFRFQSKIPYSTLCFCQPPAHQSRLRLSSNLRKHGLPGTHPA